MNSTLQIHGHRGTRGYYPENTIEGFKQAFRLGATAVELDIVVSKDHQLVVSHEPYMNHLFCRTPDGERITQETEKTFNLYDMTLSEIQRFPCGFRIDDKYPNQVKVTEYKPSLEAVVHDLPKDAFLNIEVKSEEQWYGVFQPATATYAKLLSDFIEEHLLHDRCLVQSFDAVFLNDFKKCVSDAVTIGFLIEGELNPQEQLKTLTFKPEYLNPDFTLLKKEHLHYLKSMGIKTLVWTVNEPKDIRSMIELGVDGIISDYPDRVIECLKK